MMPGKIPSSTSEAKKCDKQAAPENVSALGSPIVWPGFQKPGAGFTHKAPRWVVPGSRLLFHRFR
jgi:hypothetical protein